MGWVTVVHRPLDGREGVAGPALEAGDRPVGVAAVVERDDGDRRQNQQARWSAGGVGTARPGHVGRSQAMPPAPPAGRRADGERSWPGPDRTPRPARTPITRRRR